LRQCTLALAGEYDGLICCGYDAACRYHYSGDLFSVGTDFKTPKLHRTVRASELSYQSRGDYQADYLTVEHNTVVDLRHEFILLGRHTNAGKVQSEFCVIMKLKH